MKNFSEWILSLCVFLLIIGWGGCEKKSSSSTSSTKSTDKTETTIRKAYLDHLNEVDEHIQVEKTKSDYRVGAFLQNPVTVYTPEGTEQSVDNDAVYLGVTLREKRTKRYLPGAGISVNLNGTTRSLNETWGSFHHYGLHVSRSLLHDADSFTVSVTPPAYGRHAEMKSQHRDKANVTFSLQKDGQTKRPTVSGPSPEPVPSDYTPGSGILKGIEEAVDIQTAGPYRVGFLVEHAEPFWLWSEDGLQEQPFEKKKGNHFEIILFDKKSYVPIPSAGITLTFERKQADPTTFPLHPLLAEFYHYGTNHVIPERAKYNVTATIKPPELHTLENNRFPEQIVTFEWSPSSKEEHKEH